MLLSFLPTLAPHPTELSKVFQAGGFNLMKASVEPGP